ncbi:transporter substrate-binding domain-containing protein [Arcobacteraceae bacterium]|nr:transporter substrate-binding domain-containing protein [Arcobacteraceae bacterium]
MKDRANKRTLFILFILFAIMAHSRELDIIKKSGELRVCTAGSAYEYYEKMALVFAKHLEVKAIVTNLPSWDHQFHNEDGKTIKEGVYIPKLMQSGKCDIYPNDLVIHEWRKKKLALLPIFQTFMVVAVHKDKIEEYKEIVDLKNKHAVLMENTTYHTWLEKVNQDFKEEEKVKISFLKTYEAWKSISENKADFTVANVNGLFKKTKTIAKNIRVAFKISDPSDIGWAFNPMDEKLINNANAFIVTQQKKDSEFDKIWANEGLSLSEYMLMVSMY